MATVKKMVKKAQRGIEKSKATPKGYVRGEMTNKLYKKEVMDKWEKGMGDALDKAAGTGKYYAPKKVAKTKMQNGGTKKPLQVSIPSKFAPKGVDSKIKNAYNTPSKPTSTGKKAKSGGSFPDLNKDGKVTKADILKGRGVIARKGAKVAKSSGMKKCKYGCK
jgi:hypothetical protein